MTPASCVSWRGKLRDLGLQRFRVATLFAELLLPAALLMAGILHCRCCNEDLRRTTGLHNSPITWEGSSDRLRRSGEEEATQNCADKASSSERKAEESGRLGRKVPAGFFPSSSTTKPDPTASPGTSGQSLSLPPEEETSDWDLAVDKLTAGFQKFLEMVNGTQAFLRCVLGTHSIKLLAPWSSGSPCSLGVCDSGVQSDVPAEVGCTLCLCFKLHTGVASKWNAPTSAARRRTDGLTAACGPSRVARSINKV